MGHWETKTYTYHIPEQPTFELDKEGSFLLAQTLMNQHKIALYQLKIDGYELAEPDTVPDIRDATRVKKQILARGRGITLQAFSYKVRRWVDS